MDLTNKKSNIISNLVLHTELFMQELDKLEELHDAASSAGLSFVDADFTNYNQHLNAADFGNLRNTISSLRTLITSGHLTNLNKARP